MQHQEPKSQAYVYGGSFDPIHEGHLDLARRVLAQDKNANLYIIPAGQNPHKLDGHGAPAIARLEMTRRAVQAASLERTQVLDWECLCSAPSYTWSTLARLSQLVRTPLTLVLGNEVFSRFSDWRHPNRILETSNLLIATRNDGVGLTDCAKQLESIAPQLAPFIVEKTQIRWGQDTDAHHTLQFLCFEALPYSSTQLRKEIRRESAQGYKKKPAGLPDCVWDSIKNNGLYAVK